MFFFVGNNTDGFVEGALVQLERNQKESLRYGQGAVTLEDYGYGSMSWYNYYYYYIVIDIDRNP